MKLWIGAETQEDVIDRFRVVRKELELTINKKIEDKTYDIEIEGWDVIVILRDDFDFKEIFKLSKKRRTMDFRLQLDYLMFTQSDQFTQKKMVFSLLLRSLNLLREKGAGSDGISQLIADVAEIGSKNGWE